MRYLTQIVRNAEAINHSFTSAKCSSDGISKSSEQFCPNCGKPLILMGERTLGFPKNRKAFCEHCPFEESF